MEKKIDIPEGYALVTNLLQPHESMVQSVQLIRQVTGWSIGRCKDVLASKEPFLLPREQITALQDAGVDIYFETYEQRQIRLKEEEEREKQRKRIEAAEAWYETLPYELKEHVDVLIEANSPMVVAVD